LKIGEEETEKGVGASTGGFFEEERKWRKAASTRRPVRRRGDRKEGKGERR